MTDFTQAAELSNYQLQPQAMHIGAPGKCGYLRLGFELDSEGRSIMRDWERHAPLIVQQALYFDEAMPEMPCVYILSSGGPNVDGDRYEQLFSVKKDAYAFITTGAATKIAEMNYNFSGLDQKFDLEDNAYLEYMPEPVIPCSKSRFISNTRIQIAASASLFYSEIFLAGRKFYKEGELFKYDVMSIATQAFRPDNKELFNEKYIITPQTNHPQKIGIMDSFDVFANILMLTPEKNAIRIFDSSKAFISQDESLACSVSYLPNNAGLIFKILGNNTMQIKSIVRQLCSTLRMQIKSKPLPQEFPWR